MEQLPYLAKVNLYCVLFYLFYAFLLRRHTFFHWNRAYLNASLLLAFILPLISFHEPVTMLPERIAEVAAVPAIYISPGIAEQSFDWVHVVTGLYLAGLTLMLVNFLHGLYKLRKLIGQGEVINMEHYTLVLLPQHPTFKVGSFSFFNWLIVSSDDYENCFETILEHESVHIRQWHSADIVLVELLKSFFWFNPALWLYKLALREVHEYLADHQAANRDFYAEFLVQYARNAPVQLVTNQFYNSSLLKQRIKMIYKGRTSSWFRGKYLLIVPVAAIVVLMTASRTYKMKESPVNKSVVIRVPQKAAISNVSADTTKKNRPIKKEESKKVAEPQAQSRTAGQRVYLDRWPGFPGGNKALTKFLAHELKYPKKAFKNGIQGQVSVSFLLDEQGNMSNARVTKGPGHGLNEEALRVVKNMPQWNPGWKNGKTVSVTYTIVIPFYLEVEKLPLEIREKQPDLYRRTAKLETVKPTFQTKEKWMDYFDKKLDLKKPEPPTTTARYFANYSVSSAPPLKVIDMEFKYRRVIEVENHKEK